MASMRHALRCPMAAWRDRPRARDAPTAAARRTRWRTRISRTLPIRGTGPSGEGSAPRAETRPAVRAPPSRLPRLHDDVERDAPPRERRVGLEAPPAGRGEAELEVRGLAGAHRRPRESLGREGGGQV